MRRRSCPAALFLLGEWSADQEQLARRSLTFSVGLERGVSLEKAVALLPLRTGVAQATIMYHVIVRGGDAYACKLSPAPAVAARRAPKYQNLVDSPASARGRALGHRHRGRPQLTSLFRTAAAPAWSSVALRAATH